MIYRHHTARPRFLVQAPETPRSGKLGIAPGLVDSVHLQVLGPSGTGAPFLAPLLADWVIIT